MKINIDFWRSVLAIKSTPTATEDMGRQDQTTKQLLPGQQVRGEVLARLSEQVVLLKVGSEIFRADISVPLRSGESVNLTFQGNNPRPAFSLQQGTNNPSPVKLSPATSLLNDAVKGLPASAPGASSKVSPPLMQALPPDTAALSASLRNTLIYSGIFYESHLAQWFAGERLLSELLKEPQARFSSQRKKDPNAVIKEDKSLALLEVLEKDGDEGNNREEHNLRLYTDHMDSSTHAASILREQAQTLLSGVFRWQGEAWKDQHMDWDVEKNDGNQDTDNNTSWRTSIRLHLPNLGTISATLLSTEEGIQGHITSSSPAACELMQKEQGLLESNLIDSGLHIAGMEITCEENP